MPQFVVLSLFANDFGDIYEVIAGKGDWDEGKYWLGEISAVSAGSGGSCCSRSRLRTKTRSTTADSPAIYPGAISNIMETTGMYYLDPIEDFVNEHLALDARG